MDDLIIEGESVRLDEEVPVEVPEVPSVWAGDNPFFLVIEFAEKPESGHLGIDLDFGDWHKLNAWALRKPGIWWLYAKETQAPIMAVLVEEGDQPYFVKHHVGHVMTGAEITAFGMGKKCADGTMVRNWLLANGVICGGEDIDTIAAKIVNG